MLDDTIGFQQDPRNGHKIFRSRTTGRLRIWEFPKSLDALEHLKRRDFENTDFPGVYILFEGERKVYIGEAKNIYGRLKEHINKPDERVENWDRALIFNDGRLAAQSEFNDTVVRHSIEFYLKKLFEANKFTVVSAASNETLTPFQRIVTEQIIKEMNYILKYKNIIRKLLEEESQREVLIDELRRILVSHGFNIQVLHDKDAVINNEKHFIRPGSRKKKGWQITIRGHKPGSFLDAFLKGEGYILVNRDGVLRIPLQVIKNFISDNDAKAIHRDTVDIFVVFSDEGIKLRYHDQILDVTQYRLIAEQQTDVFQVEANEFSDSSEENSEE